MKHGEWTEADQACLNAYERDVRRLNRQEWCQRIGEQALISFTYVSNASPNGMQKLWYKSQADNH